MNTKGFPEYYRYKDELNDVPVLILGSHKIGLASIRALGIKDVPVLSAFYNENDMGMVSRYVRNKIKVTNPLENENKFIEEIISISKNNTKSVLFASDDPTLVAVSKNKHLLLNYFYVEAPDYKDLDIIISKEKTYKLAENISVRVPKTYYPENLDEAIKFFNSLNKPLILKPSLSHLFYNIFKEKMLFIKEQEELISVYNLTQKYGLKMMLQEFIPGDDTHGVNYNTFSVNGEPLIAFTARKQRLSPSRIGFPVVIKSEWIDEVIRPGRTILKALNFSGFSCMEFKMHSETGEYVLMEVNGRQNLSAPLAVKCGYNFPYITYRFLIDKSLPEIISDYDKKIFWFDSGKDMLEYLPKIIKGNYSFKKFITPYLHRKIFTIADFSDPLPLLKRGFDAFKIIFKRLFSLTKWRMNES